MVVEYDEKGNIKWPKPSNVKERVTDENEINLLQEKFERKLSIGKKCKIKTGCQGGGDSFDGYYYDKFDMWFIPEIASNSSTDEDNRFWNAFGFGNPKIGNQNIIIEVNFAFNGSLAEGSGCFIKDGDRILVCHTGRPGGGRKGIGLKNFWNHYKGDTIIVGNKDFAVVCDLDSPTYLEGIKNFVKEVYRIKPLMLK